MPDVNFRPLLSADRASRIVDCDFEHVDGQLPVAERLVSIRKCTDVNMFEEIDCLSNGRTVPM